MNVLIRTAAALCLVLLGAHYLRFGQPGMVVFLLGVLGLTFTRRRMARFVVAGVLVAGAWLWADHTLALISFRQLAGQPWLRLALIMGAVTALTFAAAALLLFKGRGAYGRDLERGPFQAALFLLTAGILFLVRAKVSFPVLLLERFAPGWGGAEVFALALYAAWIGSLMHHPRGARKVRPRIWALFSAVFFAQLALGLAGAGHFLMTGQLHLPVPALIVGGPLFRGEGLFMLILYSSTLLLVGPAWCSHLCYIGAWDDQAARMGGRRPVPGYPGLWSWGRAGTLVLVAMAAVGLRMAGVPGLAAIWLAAGFGLAGVGIMLFVSRSRGAMAHCTTYCPMGVVSNLLGPVNPWRVRLNSDCTACGACSRVCRYGALEQDNVASGKPGITCTLCGDCVSVCPHGAARYTFPGLTPNAARLAFLTMTISLHAVFLGVARI